MMDGNAAGKKVARIDLPGKLTDAHLSRGPSDVQTFEGKRARQFSFDVLGADLDLRMGRNRFHQPPDAGRRRDEPDDAGQTGDKDCRKQDEKSFYGAHQNSNPTVKWMRNRGSSTPICRASDKFSAPTGVK